MVLAGSRRICMQHFAASRVLGGSMINDLRDAWQHVDATQTRDGRSSGAFECSIPCEISPEVTESGDWSLPGSVARAVADTRQPRVIR